MFIRTLIWVQDHIFLYTAVGRLVMAFYLGVFKTNMPPQDNDNETPTLPRWEPLNHSLSLLLKVFLAVLVALGGSVP